MANIRVLLNNLRPTTSVPATFASLDLTPFSAFSEHAVPFAEKQARPKPVVERFADVGGCC